MICCILRGQRVVTILTGRIEQWLGVRLHTLTETGLITEGSQRQRVSSCSWTDQSPACSSSKKSVILVELRGSSESLVRQLRRKY